jgi:hypothetical protein
LYFLTGKLSKRVSPYNATFGENIYKKLAQHNLQNKLECLSTAILKQSISKRTIRCAIWVNFGLNQIQKTRSQCYKNFFVRNLWVFTISRSVCPWQAFPTLSNKHSSLSWKCVNYGQKCFYKICLDPNFIKLVCP